MSTYYYMVTASNNTGSLNANAEGSATPTNSNLITDGLVFHVDAQDEDTVTVDGSNYVTLWEDLSSETPHDLIESGTKPTYVNGSNGINNYPAVDFNNGGGLVTSAFNGALSNTVVLVVKIPSGRSIPSYANFIHHQDRDNNWSLERDGGGSNLIFQSNNDSQCGIPFPTDQPMVLFGRITKGSPTTRYFSMTTSNGTNSTTTSETCTSSGSYPVVEDKVLYVGRSDNTNESSTSLIGEVLYYQRALDDTERDQVINYMQSRWGF